MAYQALPPEIGLEVLLKKHIDAKEKAKKIFSIMDKEKFVPKSSDSFWNVFNGESINYKIKDMIQNAKESIFMVSSPKYIKYLENADTNLKLDIVVFSETSTFETLKKHFKEKKGNFKVVNEEDMLNLVASSKTKDQKQFEIYKEALLMVEYRNMVMLAIDDEEVLYMPPMSTNSLTAINTKNKAMTILMKIGLSDITNLS
jgi:Predicted transcriptional regulators